MADRGLFYPATPEVAYLVARDQTIPAPDSMTTSGDDLVELVARRGGCPGGTAVGVTVDEHALLPGDPGRPGSFRVPREAITPGSIGRAFQPWHADVEPDAHQRWKGYLQPDSLTLRNLIGAQTPGALEAREAALVEWRLLELAEQPITTPATFGLEHLQQIHRRLFQDVYPWAGETRTVQIGRPGGPGFFDWEAIAEGYGEIQERLEASDLLRGATRAEFTEEAMQVYNAVNTVHAFREGNGRTQREWMGDLARGAGYELDWSGVHGFTNDVASRRAREGDLTGLRQVLETITRQTPPPGEPARTTGPPARRQKSRMNTHRAPRDDYRPPAPRAGGPSLSN